MQIIASKGIKSSIIINFKSLFICLHKYDYLFKRLVTKSEIYLFIARLIFLLLIILICILHRNSCTNIIVASAKAI